MVLWDHCTPTLQYFRVNRSHTFECIFRKRWVWWIKTIAMMNDVIERWNEKQHQSLYFRRVYLFLCVSFVCCEHYNFTPFLPAVKVVTTNIFIGWCVLFECFFFVDVQLAVHNFAISNESIVIAHDDSWLSTFMRYSMRSLSLYETEDWEKEKYRIQLIILTLAFTVKSSEWTLIDCDIFSINILIFACIRHFYYGIGTVFSFWSVFTWKFSSQYVYRMWL